MFKVILGDSVELPLVLKDCGEIKARISDILIGNSSCSKVALFYSAEDALAMVSTFKSDGTARVVLDPSAKTMQQERFSTFLQRFESSQTVWQTFQPLTHAEPRSAYCASWNRSLCVILVRKRRYCSDTRDSHPPQGTFEHTSHFTCFHRESTCVCSCRYEGNSSLTWSTRIACSYDLTTYLVCRYNLKSGYLHHRLVT